MRRRHVLRRWRSSAKLHGRCVLRNGRSDGRVGLVSGRVFLRGRLEQRDGQYLRRGHVLHWRFRGSHRLSRRDLFECYWQHGARLLFELPGGALLQCDRPFVCRLFVYCWKLLCSGYKCASALVSHRGSLPSPVGRANIVRARILSRPDGQLVVQAVLDRVLVPGSWQHQHDAVFCGLVLPRRGRSTGV